MDYSSALRQLRAEMQVDIILLLAQYGYPPTPPEIYERIYADVIQQAENFKKYTDLKGEKYMAKININRQSYWEECIDAFNKAIDDNKFSATFKKLDKNKDIHKDSNTGRVKEWIDVLTSATTGMFNLSFNICDDTAKIDLYFFNNKYDIKKSRDAFLKKYNDTYNSSTQFQPGKDKNNKDSENPDARVRFVKSDKIQSGNYTDAIDWQIDTLVNTYNNILNLNQEMINNSEYPLALTVSNLSEEKLLQEFVNWLKKKSISSANQYLTPLQGKNKTLILNYLSKSSILDITKEDCDKIFDNASSVFQGLNDPTNYKTYIKHFGTYLQENNNGGSSISESQTTMIYKMLDENKQVILTGAPGTGKTFTVKEYVEGKEFKFVQFHPSYDYSDFVEGLRPVPDSTSTTHGNMFVRLDGIFKEFCRKIVMDELQKIKDSGSSISMSDIDAFEEYRKRYTKVEEENDDHNVTKADEQTEIPNKESTDNNPQENIKQEAAEKQYYFIIDEINRADLSKVFGEIMYCLDEDYRGPENAIQTQYSALNTYHKVIKDDGSGKDITTYEEYDFDCFEKGFFIPHNLHIIGTMNDIDRSVESFDFALRRRFIWKEVDANGSINELEKIVTSEKIKSTEMNLSDLKDKAIRINNLFDLEPQAGNKEPEFKDIKRLGLNKQYQLGKAYYKDFDGSKSSLEKIYRGKIEPIIKEYTRGRDANIVKNFLDKVKENL